MAAKMHPVLGIRSGVDVTFKVCTGCGEAKHVEEFNRHPTAAYGRQARCRACEAACYAANADHRRAQQAAYYAANRDRKRAYYAANADRERARAADYRAANADRVRAHQASYRAANPRVRWRVNAAQRLRALGFPEQAARALEQTFTRGDVIARYGGQCVYCGGPFEHLDHYVPLRAGGEHDLDNCRPSCAEDNIAKSANEPEPDTEGSQS